jgi:hypothetical protein
MELDRRRLRDEVIKELRSEMLYNLEWRYGNLEQWIANLHARVQSLEKSK